MWGRYGPWREREAAIAATLWDASPDIVVLTRVVAEGRRQPVCRLSGPLGLPYHAFSGVTAQEDEAALSGVAVTGRTTAPVPGLSFYDAWEVAGPPTPGHTWSNDNPRATQLLWPNRRIDYIFSAAPRPAARATPRTPLCWAPPPSATPTPQNHYALHSSLRY